MNLTQALRTALIGQSSITDLLGVWKGEPSVHTRRPVPTDATYPLIVVSKSVGGFNNDGLKTKIPIVMRNLTVYGQNPKDYRSVEECADIIKAFFHRTKDTLVIDGFEVLAIEAMEPQAAPTEDETTCASVIVLTIRMRDLS